MFEVTGKQGTPVRFRDGPAAVTEDCSSSFSFAIVAWANQADEKAPGDGFRKSEDLPTRLMQSFCEGGRLPADAWCRACGRIERPVVDRPKVLLSWSGGKDCALALYEVQQGGHEVAALLTTAAATYERVSHHGVRNSLVDRQGEACGIPIHWSHLAEPYPVSNERYEQATLDVLATYREQGIETVVYGDIHLADVLEYRKQLLDRAGMKLLAPLWQQDPHKLARRFIELGFQAYLTSVEERLAEFAGEAYDQKLLDRLPADVDPCGELGEFHTFVWDAPMFAAPIPVCVGERLQRDGRCYADLTLIDDDSSGFTSNDVPPLYASSSDTGQA